MCDVMADIFDDTLMAIALGGLAVSLVVLAFAAGWPYIKAAWDRASKFARAVFCLAAAGAVMFGGAKHRTGGISYPKTDNEIAYLTDAGSYVTNDAVHVAFTRLPMVPDTATFYLDYCALDGTNAQGVATNWVNAKTATFADLSVPFDFAFAAATNYNWLAYTDWTPGPAVQTNGVWHAYWGIDKKQGRYFIPVRTCVRDGGEVIATPKSKWDAATRTPDDYVQDGLVAMWDGEWNAGRGVHDPNATVWVDLTGNGHDATVENGTSWGNKSFNCGNHAAIYKGVLFGGNFTAELITRGNLDEMTDPWPARLCCQCDFWSFFSNNRINFGAKIPGSSRTYITPVYLDPVYIIHDDTKPDVVAYYSHEYSNYSTSNVYTSQSHSDTWYIGGNTSRHLGESAKFYCVRLYNRALTAAEVAHNYAVDKARFGSGNE